jgi:hypothetical protein
MAKTSKNQPKERVPQRIQIQRPLSKGQLMLQEMFQGERTFGTGQNLPQFNRDLISGGGIIKSGDRERETAQLFGLK